MSLKQNNKKQNQPNKKYSWFIDTERLDDPIYKVGSDQVVLSPPVFFMELYGQPANEIYEEHFLCMEL